MKGQSSITTPIKKINQKNHESKTDTEISLIECGHNF